MDTNFIKKELRQAASLMTARIRHKFDKDVSSRAKMYLRSGAEDIKTYYPDNTDLEILTYTNEDGNFIGVAFQGRSKKALWHYRFNSESRLEQRIDAAVDSRRQTLERKEQEKRERREFKHSLSEGDFLYTSWGYDQTNVNFYQVTKVIGKMVEIREVAKKVVKSSPPQDYVEPVKNRFIGPKMKKKVGMGDSVKIKSYAHASKWDGRPKYQTSLGWGH